MKIGQGTDSAWAVDAGGAAATSGSVLTGTAATSGSVLTGTAAWSASMWTRDTRMPRCPDTRMRGTRSGPGKHPLRRPPGWQQGHNYMDMSSLPNQDGAMIVGETKTIAEYVPRRVRHGAGGCSIPRRTHSPRGDRAARQPSPQRLRASAVANGTKNAPVRTRFCRHPQGRFGQLKPPARGAALDWPYRANNSPPGRFFAHA